ncbi:hypothetical protein GGI15_001493 [Coemansia interrupta]|uniref:Uncharacterized protein n=1 Tax=Coemansia interrupta TaxID=1126814 RepID=A0A9W8LMH5_9FUNG|nr:hypothetical protein GGI15_001493 [Coemansia interrupta]
MAHAAHISPDIISGIMNYAIDANVTSYRQWKDQLPLLSVCHKWRAAAVPLVYRTVVFQSRGAGAKHETLDTNVFTGEFDSSIIATNLSLMRDIGIDCYVSKVAFSLFSLTHSNWLFASMLLAHQQNTQIWANVDSIWLSLNFDYCLGAFNVEKSTNVVDKDISSERLHLLARFVRGAMPKVADITLHSHAWNYTESKFFSRLMDLYAGQLQRIDSNAFTDLAAPTFSDNLAHLTILCNRNSVQMLPRIPTAKLEYMKLIDVPTNFSWSYFRNDDQTTGDIVFSELHTLSISFKAGDEGIETQETLSKWRLPEFNSGSIAKVQFPKLESLKVSEMPEITDLRFDDAFPAHLQRLVFTNNECRQDMFKDCPIVSVDKVYARIVPSSTQTTDGFYSCTNFLFGKLASTAFSYFVVDVGAIQFRPEMTAWSSLLDLEIGGISNTHVLDLLLRTTSLVNLYIKNAVCTKSAFDPSFDVNEWAAVSVQNVYISGQQRSGVKDLFSNTAKNLLLRARSLKGFYGLPSMISTLRPFMAQFKEHCPHLSGLDLRSRYNPAVDLTGLEM